jgi:hypothetical protein
MLALQARSPEFVPQSHKKQTKNEYIFFSSAHRALTKIYSGLSTCLNNIKHIQMKEEMLSNYIGIKFCFVLGTGT